MQNTKAMTEEFPEIQLKEGKNEYGKLIFDLVGVIQKKYIEMKSGRTEIDYLNRIYTPIFQYSQTNPQKLLKDKFPDFEILKKLLPIEEEIPSDLFIIYICTALSIEAVQAHNAKENLLSIELLISSYYWCGFQNCIDKHDSIMAETLIKENNSRQGLEKALVRHRRNREIRDEACNLARELGPWINYPEAAEAIYKILENQLINELGSGEPRGLLKSWFEEMPDRMKFFKMARTAPSPKKKK